MLHSTQRFLIFVCSAFTLPLLAIADGQHNDKTCYAETAGGIEISSSCSSRNTTCNDDFSCSIDGVAGEMRDGLEMNKADIVNKIAEKTDVADADGDSISTGGNRATDYNSSRSNKADGNSKLDSDSDAVSSAKTRMKSGGALKIKVEKNKFDKDTGANHNSTRSNKTKPVADDSGDDSGEVDAADYALWREVNQSEPTTVLARVYIDVNKNGEYNDGDDLNIAQLLDRARPFGEVSVGDQIVLGVYPKFFEACPTSDPRECLVGDFAPGPFPVTGITSVNSGRIVVTTAGATWDFKSNRDHDQFLVQDKSLMTLINMLDSKGRSGFDTLRVMPGGEPMTNDTVTMTRPQDPGPATGERVVYTEILQL